MTIEGLFTYPAVQYLGWALLHFIWQGTVLAALFFAADVLTRRSHARLRYAVGCAVMLSMLLAFAGTIVRGYLLPSPSYSSHDVDTIFPAPATNSTVVDGGFRAAPAGDGTVAPPSRPWPSNALLGWIACLWLAAVIALSVSMAAGCVRVRRLTRRGIQPADPAWVETLQRLIERMRVSQPVRLYTSAIAEVPAVIGWLRPCILLPLSAVTGLSEPQLRAILAHELAHIRRHDYLVNLLQSTVETLLFYHPAVWWVSCRIRQEREHCSDDLAIAVCGNVSEYAGALVRLEELRGSLPEPAMAATGGDLLGRVRRLTGQKSADRIPIPIGAAVAALLAIAAALAAVNVPALLAQSEPPIQRTSEAQPPVAANAKFEVASVKPCRSGAPAADGGGRGAGGGIVTSPGRLIATCQTVSQLIRYAFLLHGDGKASTESMLAESIIRQQFAVDSLASSGLPARKISLRLANAPIDGSPAWLSSDRYTVEAKAPGTPDENFMRGPMLQALLEERFKLKIHAENRDLPVYELTAASGGAKLKSAQPGSCIPLSQRSAVPQSPIPPDQRTAANMPCGLFIRSSNNNGLDVNGTTMANLSQDFSAVLDRDVVDKTGIEGLFDVHLDINPDPPPVDANGEPVARSAPDPVRTLADIRSAIKKLGLNLEPAKGTGNFLVIDHIERPPEN